MRPSLSGALEVGAPIADVWPRNIDPHIVARHGPGIESMEALDPRHFKVVTAFGVGSMRLRFGIDVELVDVNPPSFFTMKPRGRAPGSAVEVTAELGLEPIDLARARLSRKANTDSSGSVASIGARLMESSDRKLTEQFWTKFITGIADAGAAPAVPPLPASPPGPAASAAPPST